MNTVIGKRKAKDLVGIKEIIYNAHAFNTQNWINGYKVKPENFPKIIDNFLRILAEYKIDFVVVGGIAMLSYMHERNTQDLDLIVSKADFQKIAWSLKILEQNEDFANCETLDGLRVDFLFTDNAIFNYVKKGFCHKISFAEGDFLTATVEGLILMKLYAWADLRTQGLAFNDKNFLTKAIRYRADIEVLLISYEVNLEPILRILQKVLSENSLTQIEELLKTIGK